MTEPSQYFKGRTVQEQMDEVIGYVDKRAEEVAAAKADDVLQPAEAAKTAAQAAAQEAEAAKNATIAALPAIQQDISDLKAENVALDGRLNTVELKVQTAEGDIAALQNADTQNVKINAVNQYAVGLTGNQNNIAGAKIFLGECTGTSYFGVTNKMTSFAINDRSVKNRSWCQPPPPVSKTHRSRTEPASRTTWRRMNRWSGTQGTFPSMAARL